MTSLDMYKEQILELYKHPNNFGTLKNPSHHYKEFNPLCGDEIQVDLIMENNKVKDIKFQGQGCAISLASASLITDKVKNMSSEDINKISFEDIKTLLGVPIVYTRVKCATLALEAIKRAINNKDH